jgi:hypothetical protein
MGFLRDVKGAEKEEETEEGTTLSASLLIGTQRNVDFSVSVALGTCSAAGLP